MEQPRCPRALVRLLGLCKTFGAQCALDQVSLDIYPGEGVACCWGPAVQASRRW